MNKSLLSPRLHLRLLKKYLALLAEASRLESEADALRTFVLAPHTNLLLMRLGLPLEALRQPALLRTLEIDRGFVCLSLLLSILTELGLTWAEFEATGKEIKSDDPDVILGKLIERSPAFNIKLT